MKKKKTDSARVSSLQIIIAVALVSMSALLLASSVAPPAGPTRSTSGAAPARLNSPTPVFVRAVGFAVSAPARTFPAAQRVSASNQPGPPEINPEAHEVNELNARRVRINKAAPSIDAALQTTLKPKEGTSAPSGGPPPTILTFEGISVADGNNVAPPDTNGAVGPNDYVETVNDMVRVFDKNGNPRGPGFHQSNLFANVGGVCAGDRGDPVVVYDRIANRWVLTQFGFTSSDTPPYFECMAISTTPDPTGSYFAYAFSLPGEEFPDYPKIGVWPDGYYMTTNQFFQGGSFDGTGAFAFERNKMLVGDPSAGLIYFNLNLATHPEGVFGVLPSDHNGLLPPPSGAPNVFVYFTATTFGDPADGLRLFNFHADFANPLFATFAETQTTYPAPLALAAFDARSPSGRAHVEQPPPATAADNLDSVGERMMYRLQYQNRNGTESLVANFTVNVSGVAPTGASTYQAGLRYFELQRTSPGNPYTVAEQATFAPGAGDPTNGPNRWMGSAAADSQNNLAVGYSISSTSVNPSLNYAARAFNDPPNGLFQGEGTMFAGTGVQRVTGNRWGDYSALQLDPSDDCTFWYTNEYYTSTSSQFNWQTRIGKFKFATCTAPQQGTLAGTITACDTGQPLPEALIQISGGPSDGFSTSTLPNGTYSVQLAPGTYTVTVTDTVHNCSTTSTASNIVITNGATTTRNVCLTGTPSLSFQSTVISGGNGDTIIDRNECNNLDVAIQNIGCLRASAVSAVLSSSTTGVTIIQPNSSYPDISENLTGTNNAHFRVETSPSFVCGTPISFTLTVNYTGGSAVINFTLPSCGCADMTVSGSLDPSDPKTTQGRLGRNGISSTCEGKPCPGPLGTGQNSYDALTFTNQGAVPACVTATLTSAGGSLLIGTSYLGTFDPTDTSLCNNYLGDAGGSANGSVSWSFTVPASQSFQVVVMEVNPGTPSTPYSVTVSGLVCNIDGGGPCGAATPTPTPTPSTTPVVNVSASVTHVNSAGSATITVSCNSSPGGPLTINYSTAGRARLGTDYTLSGTPGQVTIGAGQTSAQITLQSLATHPTNKVLNAKLILQSGAGYNLGSNTQVTIRVPKKRH